MTDTSSPVWHPFTQHGLNEAQPLIDRADGATLTCRDGSELIDGISSWWVVTHGHCHPPIISAIREQAEKLDQVIFAGFTHEPAERVAKGLIRLTDRHLPSHDPLSPDPLTHVFFSDSGSTSVEVALKMALGYWHRHARDHGGKPRHRIIVMEHSYHGDTIGTMSVGARGVFNQVYTPLLFDVTTIPYPAAGREQAMLDALEAACRAAHDPADKPAALIVEPLILGSGGMLFYSPATLKAMAQICAAYDVLFIADEVMTAWGRTGTLFACEPAEITPDILCLSKGMTGGSLPLAATLARRKIFDAHVSDDRADMFFHSSSFTANPIACAAAAANIAIWESEDMPARIASRGAAMQQHIDRLSTHKAFTNARRMGAIAAIDLITTGENGYMADVAPKLRAFFLERGLLLRPLGNTIYVLPPYCISDTQLNQIFTAIDEAGHLFGS
ncbi:MAG: adenosylmethionine--8-amino-7-oxononanoate transaminase [Sphingobium sp.]|nr:adenosylmethionine--8-amino-7-oxononanoate transaminase [Sphingobium sp.]